MARKSGEGMFHTCSEGEETFLHSSFPPPSIMLPNLPTAVLVTERYFNAFKLKWTSPTNDKAINVNSSCHEQLLLKKLKVLQFDISELKGVQNNISGV